jgi:dTDP-4-amino-4,6-dideoxygalactose transaminase
MSAGAPSEEKRFGDAFAAYHGVPYGVPVSNGSAALTVALEAVGVGHGDEVLVPGLVWVACASAVARVGGIPILVDVEEHTFCMSPAAAEAAITARTRAILLVHLYSSIADLDAFAALATGHDLALLEDCAQAHGAMWRDRHVGTFGAAGSFSFQNSKLLTAGEGGIVITSNPALYEAAQQLRSDGRRWAAQVAEPGFPDLDEVGERQGHNHCMTEFQAAILHEALADLDEQNQRRLANVERFERQLAAVAGVSVVRQRDERVTLPTFYHLPLRIEREAFAGASIGRVGRAVAAEVGLFLEPVDVPLNAHALYQPSRYRRFSPARRRALDPNSFTLPSAAALSLSCFTVPHHAFLASEQHIDRLVEAIAHVQRHADTL